MPRRRKKGRFVKDSGTNVPIQDSQEPAPEGPKQAPDESKPEPAPVVPQPAAPEPAPVPKAPEPSAPVEPASAPEPAPVHVEPAPEPVVPQPAAPEPSAAEVNEDDISTRVDAATAAQPANVSVPASPADNSGASNSSSSTRVIAPGETPPAPQGLIRTPDSNPTPQTTVENLKDWELRPGITLEEKIGSGGMGDVYRFLITNGKIVESWKEHNDFLADNLLLYYTFNTGKIQLEKLGYDNIQLEALGYDNFSKGMNPRDTIRTIYRTPGLIDDIIKRVKSKGNKGGFEILNLPEYANLTAKGALKITQPSSVNWDEMIFRAQREAELQGRAAHFNIVSKLFSGVIGERAYMGLEYVDELINLEHKKLTDSGVILPEAVVFELGRIVLGLVEFLALLGITQRDVKPDNIMVCRAPYLTKGGIIVPMNTEKGMVYVPAVIKFADLGLAGDMNPDKTKMTGTDIVHGTGPFMAPERINYQITKPSGDVWSLGAALYELVAGKLPFGSYDITPAGTLGKILDPTTELELPSVGRKANSRGPRLTPFFESLIAEMLMRGFREKDSDYMEARPGPGYFIKKCQIVVPKMPDVYDDMEPKERLEKMQDALKLPTKMDDDARAKINGLRTEISEVESAISGTKKKPDDDDLDPEAMFGRFGQEKLIAMKNYEISDLLPISVKKEVDTPEPRATKAVYLERGIEHHNNAVSLIRKIWVGDILNYLLQNIGDTNLKSIAEEMRGCRHIHEKIAKSKPKEDEQTVRLLEVLLRREAYLPEAINIKKLVVDGAGGTAHFALSQGRDEFIEFKGRRAYSTLVDTVTENEYYKDAIVIAKGTRALQALLSTSKQTSKRTPEEKRAVFDSLKGREIYAEVLKEIGDGENAYETLSAKLSDNEEMKKAVTVVGEAYWAALRVSDDKMSDEDSKIKDEYIREEGEGAYRIYLKKNGIGLDDPEAHKKLVDMMKDNPAKRKGFVENEGMLVYKGTCGRLDDYCENTQLDELRSRQWELKFQTWLDRTLGRETSSRRSTTSEDPDAEIDDAGDDESVFRTFSNRLESIIEGHENLVKGIKIRGYKAMLVDLGHYPRRKELAELREEMDKAQVEARFEKLNIPVTAIIKNDVGDKIADSAKPLYRKTIQERGKLIASLKLPELLYNIMVVENRDRERAEIAELEPEVRPDYKEAIDAASKKGPGIVARLMGQDGPDPLKKQIHDWNQEISVLKNKLVISADTIEDDCLPEEKGIFTEETRGIGEAYVAALRLYESQKIEYDSEGLAEVATAMVELQQAKVFNLDSSIELYCQLNELSQAVRLARIKSDVPKADKLLSQFSAKIDPPEEGEYTPEQITGKFLKDCYRQAAEGFNAVGLLTQGTMYGSRAKEIKE